MPNLTFYIRELDKTDANTFVTSIYCSDGLMSIHGDFDEEGIGIKLTPEAAQELIDTLSKTLERCKANDTSGLVEAG